MQELLQAYSVEDILIFLSLLIIAAKEAFAAFDDFKSRGKLWFTAEQKKEDNEVSLRELGEKIDNIEKSVELLKNSDKDDIRGWLIEKYNFYKSHPTIVLSDYTLDAIEKRYSHYTAEGGNSYIENSILPALREMAKEDQRIEL